MKVTEHLEKANEPPISFEIIPPKRGDHVSDILNLVKDLQQHRPPFIDITSHPAEVVYEETPDGIQRHVKRKRPGTLGVCALIQHKYKIDAVPHVLCHGFTQQETEDFLIELRYLGIDNVLAIRGDDKGYRKPLRDGRTANRYAADLIRQINSMNAGKYLDEHLEAAPTEFCVGAAGYPEKHFEAPNMEADVRRALEKVEAGAEYIVTQMFFENSHYFTYVEACRRAGIDVPIIPGLKVITRRGHLRALPRVFHCEIPKALADELESAPAKDIFDIGVAWTRQQSRELLEGGAPALHYYVMNDARAVNSVIDGLR
jgi:methylenetetrahydrofolate reductase (NADPH)